MKNWRQPFEGKKITVMGLGLLGRGIADIKFLHDAGAILTVTDLKSEEQLAPALVELKDLGGITYVLGEHRLEDFEGSDYVLRGADIPLNNVYLAHAKKHGVQIKMDESWVAELVPEATYVGVTGTRGKSTTAMMIYHSLKELNANVHLGGNVPSATMLPQLKNINAGDIVVMELSSWQLQGWHEAGISPQIGIFTNFMEDHLNYYGGDMALYFKDKAGIFEHQSNDGILIISQSTEEAIERYYQGDINSTVIVAEADDVPEEWELKILGSHNREVAAYALRALEALGVNEDGIKKGLTTFTGVPGRLEYLGMIKGARTYNDNNATTPAATIAGLEAVGGEKNVVLIMGGTDKGISFKDFYAVAQKRCKHIVVLDEAGSRAIIGELKKNKLSFEVCNSPENCVAQAVGHIRGGDVLLYSPAFASFGIHFKNEYDRGDKFRAALEPFLS
ncbi:MAG: UDP-N-acetylmuramoyl-L-alanine--D-glutamate ligase [bacterium]|nr:UDP-N-acetylmuramoyl-L-alanine--D-glutamate ligase [bacterium]